MTSTGCGVGCDTVSTGNLAFVGSGRGDWITETTYRYVGVGAGDLAVITSRRTIWPWICAALVLLALILAIVFWPRATSTTVKAVVLPIVEPPPPAKKQCIFWGDPHVITFDGAHPSFYGEGEYWIVKNPRVQIQGRYEGTKYTFGLASTRAVVVGGPFIGGHTIEIGPMDDDFGSGIRVDGRVVLREHGSLEVGGARVTFNGEGELVDDATSRWSKNVVHLDLPEDIQMEVFRWANYLDLRITMAPLEDEQDGSCGNFNGRAEDDSTLAIFDRIGHRVGDDEVMFTTPAAHVDFSDQMDKMLANHCDDNVKYAARGHCEEEFGQRASEKELKSCLFDHCFGQNEHALQTAKHFASQKELEEAGLI